MQVRSATALLCCSVALAQSMTAHAEEDRSAAIVVTGSRTGSSVGTATLDAAEFAAPIPDSLVAVLDNMPGVHAFETGGPGAGSFVSIRGGEANFAPVLIDGVRVNDLTNASGGAFDFGLIDPGQIASLAVFKGPGSAIHGPDALSGVVQLVLRSPPRSGVSADAMTWLDTRYGGGGTLQLGSGWGSGGALISGSFADSGPGDPAGTLVRKQGLLKLEQRAGPFDLSSFVLHATRSSTGFPEDSGGPLLAAIRTLEQRQGTLTVAALQVTLADRSAIVPHLLLSHTVQDSTSDTPAIAPGAFPGLPAVFADNRFARSEALADLTAAVGPHRIAFGAGLVREDGRSDGTLDFGFKLPVRFSQVRTIRSLFAEATLHPATTLSLNAAVRYDHSDAAGGQITGSGEAVWQPGIRLPRLFFRAGSGFKLPSLYALGHPLIGNPGLLPERSKSFEIGSDWQISGISLSLALFDNRFRNLIDFDPGVFQLVNRASVGITGGEFAISGQIGPHLTAAGGVTYLSVDSATPLRGRPAWSGSLRIDWADGPWQAGFQLRAATAVNDSSIPTGPATDGRHATLDLSLGRQLGEHVLVRLALRNAGDERAWVAVGTPRPGRSLRLALEFH